MLFVLLFLLLEPLKIAKPEIDRLSAEAKEAVAQGKDGSHYSTEVQKLWAKHGIHPGRTLLVNLVNLPVMLLLPFSIINLPKLGLPSLQAESFLWMSDISAADPYYVLPTTASILLFGAIHFNMSPEAMTPQMRQILPVFKILPIAFLPISVTLPAVSSFHFPSLYFFPLVQDEKQLTVDFPLSSSFSSSFSSSSYFQLKKRFFTCLR